MSVRDGGLKRLCGAPALTALVAIALLSAALVSACNPNPQPAGLTPIPTLASGATTTPVAALPADASASVAAGPADGAAGAAVYFENCSPCHGLQAEGITGPALRNNKLIQASSDQVVASIITQGRAGTAMPAWLTANGGALNAAQIADVVAFLRSYQNVAPLPTATPLPPAPTETPAPANAPTEEPARPSNEGAPGNAVNLTGNADHGRVAFGQYCASCHGPQGQAGRPNPDSDDGAVPGINPIDPTIISADAKTFAANIDLFIEHGSVPAGPKPQIMMPAFGDGKLLTDQQIADILAYIIALNSH
jgi:mono/diheme cytochrome c family protein